MSQAFLVAFGAMSLAGAVPMLSIPPLFGQHRPYQEQVAGWAGGLCVVLAATVDFLRTAARRGLRPRGAE